MSCLIKTETTLVIWLNIVTIVGKLPLFPAVKEFWKSVKNWQSYRPEFGVPLFWDTVYIHIIYTGHCGLARLRGLANPRTKEARVNPTCIFRMYRGWVLPTFRVLPSHPLHMLPYAYMCIFRMSRGRVLPTFRVLPSHPLHMYIYTLLTRSYPTCICVYFACPANGFSPHFVSCHPIRSTW